MKSFRDNLPVVMVLVLTLVSLPAYVLAANNTLEIQCVDRSGNPVAGAKVEIQNVETQKWKDKKSDAKGIARFDKADDGIYRIRSRKDGFSPALYEFVALKGDKQETVKLQFEAGTDHPLYFEEQGKETSQKAMEALRAGLEDLKANKFADAENKLKTALTMNPFSPDANYFLGVANLQQNKYSEAEECFKTAARVAGALTQLKQPEGSQQPNPYANMAQNAGTLVQKMPGFKLRAEGSANLQKSNFTGAVASFKEAIKYFPDDSDIYYNLALAQAQAKSFDEAEQNIQKAISMKAGDKGYTDLKTQIEGLKENEKVKKAQAMLDEGEALFKKNDFAGALQKYQEAKQSVTQPKGQALIMTFIGKAEAGLNHHDQAVAAYKQAIELDPEKAAYKQAFAQYYMSQKKFDEALNLYASAGGSSDQALVTLGQNLSKQGNAEVAQLAFERAIQANPSNAEAYYELGMMLYFAKANDKRAKELLTKYSEIGKDSGHLDNAKNFLVVIEKRLK